MTTTVKALSLPFEEAIAYLAEKTNATSTHWTDVWQRANARAFTVAGAAKKALVKDFRTEVAKALEQGTTLADFRARFDDIVKKHGWKHTGTPGWRARIIYETNLSMAYSAGRYAQATAPETLAQYPYWQYVHSGSQHPRLEHLSWNGLVLRADDSWWDTHYPANGWRCGCRVRVLSARDLARQGKSGPDQAPPIETRAWTNPKTGQVHQVPRGIDPGFDYNPGQAWLGTSVSLPPNATLTPPPITPPPKPKPKPEPATPPKPKAAPPPSLGRVQDGATKAMLKPKTTARWRPVVESEAKKLQRADFREAEANLTGAARAARQAYIEDDYQPWNAALRRARGKVPPDYAAPTKALDEAIAARTLPDDMLLVRDAGYVKGIESANHATALKGFVIDDPAFFSTTALRGGAGFELAADAPPAPSVRYFVRARKGMKAIAGTAFESEYIFPRGSRWRVLDVEVIRNDLVHVLVEPA